jgi:hypothetical protein
MEQVDFAPPKVKIPGGFYEAMQRARELLVELAEDAHDGGRWEKGALFAEAEVAQQAVFNVLNTLYSRFHDGAAGHAMFPEGR